MTEREDDIAWIEARERGVVSDHPRAALYARLGAAIAALPPISGGGGWQAAVLDDLDRGTDELRRARAARSRRRGIVAAIVSSLAIAAILFVIVRPSPPKPVEPDLAYQHGAADGARRSTGTVAIGERLTVSGRFPGAGELWIYRGDRLVLRCPGGDGCTSTSIAGGHRLEAVLRTDVALTYTAVLVNGRTAAPTGALQADIDTAGTAIAETLTLDVH